jgi:hypothetical protein
MGRIKGLWGRAGQPAVLFPLAVGLVLANTDLYVRISYGKPFLDLVFWQLLATTFIGAMLALAAAWGLYIYQQRASGESRRLAVNREALNLLQSSLIESRI